jgi:urease accessory protein
VVRRGGMRSNAIALCRRAGASPHAGPGDLSGPALYRLMTWMSPAYPVGAFAYSSGIEWAVEAGDLADAETLCRWLAAMISHGSVFCDAA